MTASDHRVIGPSVIDTGTSFIASSTNDHPVIEIGRSAPSGRSTME